MKQMQDEYRQLDNKYSQLSNEHKEQQVVCLISRGIYAQNTKL